LPDTFRPETPPRRSSAAAAAARLKAPLGRADREQGWTDELRREIQEEISINCSMLRHPGPWAVKYLRPRLDEWLAREACSRDATAMWSWKCRLSSLRRARPVHADLVLQQKRPRADDQGSHGARRGPRRAGQSRPRPNLVCRMCARRDGGRIAVVRRSSATGSWELTALLGCHNPGPHHTAQPARLTESHLHARPPDGHHPTPTRPERACYWERKASPEA
jgi:hypothetical protein